MIPLAMLVAGVGAAAAFVVVERGRADPVLQLDLFRRGAYTAVNANGLVMGFVTIGAIFVFSLLFQQAQGLSALAAGLRFLPLTVVFVVVGPLVGRALGRLGHRLPMAAGAALLAVGSLVALEVSPRSGFTAVALPFAIIGLGYGLLSTPMAAAVLGAVPPERAGMASSTNLTARLVGGVFGIAVLGSLLPSGGATPIALAAGMHAAMVVSAAVAGCGAVLAVTMIREPQPPQRVR